MLVWAQNANSIKRILFLQEDFFRPVRFFTRNVHTTNIFKNWFLLKSPDKVTLDKFARICKYFSQSLSKTFKNWFTLATTSYTHNTRRSNSGCLKISSHKLILYGRHSVNISAIVTWNSLQNLHPKFFVLWISFE